MNALVRLLATVAFDVAGSRLAHRPAVLTLRYRATFLVDVLKRTVCGVKLAQSCPLVGGAVKLPMSTCALGKSRRGLGTWQRHKRLTRMLAVADTMASYAGLASPFLSFDDHGDDDDWVPVERKKVV